ncbi:MAG: AraC family transcriptional regulator [Bacteroidaceae bacterium]|nr:AraC family transcriptional regulator [Bacteroidaceae bacterium]
MNYHLSFDLSQFPKEMSDARLGNYFLFFDNLSGDKTIEHSEKKHFPIKVEAMLVLSVLKGGIRLRVNLQETNLKEGQVLNIMPGCIFQIVDTTEDFKYFCMIFDQEILDHIQKSFGVHLDLIHKYYNFHKHAVPQESMTLMMSMYMQIKKELEQPDYEYKKEVVERYCEIWILKSMSNSVDASVPELSKTANRKEQIFRDFLTLLEKNYHQERSIAYYADRLCLTPKYLSTIIKEVSGKHGLQWIDEYVALEAKALLREGHLSVKQVSDSLNFPSQSMFGRFFKKMTGYTPKKYMQL